METSKARFRREKEGFFGKYFTGKTLDIGCGSDPIFPDCDKWDYGLGNTDASMLAGVDAASYETVYSSHCLEHLNNPHEALTRWFEVVKPGGHLIIVVPERDLYEKRKTLPSRWNGDHKLFFTLGRDEPPCTYGLVPLIARSLEGKAYRILRAETCDAGHTIADPDKHSDGEYSVEVVVRKL